MSLTMMMIINSYLPSTIFTVYCVIRYLFTYYDYKVDTNDDVDNDDDEHYYFHL